jgi:hypothetical protein
LKTRPRDRAALNLDDIQKLAMVHQVSWSFRIRHFLFVTMDDVPVRVQPPRPTVPPRTLKGPLDHIHINPNVTRTAQRELAAKLHAEIATDAELDRAFRRRPMPVKSKDRHEDQARIFNEFCVAFIEASKQTKEQVANVLDEANTRLRQLDDVRLRLEDVERRTYRFEMDLPDESQSLENDLERQLKEEKEEARKRTISAAV